MAKIMRGRVTTAEPDDPENGIEVQWVGDTSTSRVLTHAGLYLEDGEDVLAVEVAPAQYMLLTQITDTPVSAAVSLPKPIIIPSDDDTLISDLGGSYPFLAGTGNAFVIFRAVLVRDGDLYWCRYEPEGGGDPVVYRVTHAAPGAGSISAAVNRTCTFLVGSAFVLWLGQSDPSLPADALGQ